MPARRPPSRGRPAGADRTQRLRRYWDNHARSYDRQMAFWERRLFADGRHWVCAQATGEVLEVAIGTGRNLPLYPDGIHLTGIDFSPQMLHLAQRRAEQLGHQVDLRLGDAQALDLPDASFDTVVCTLSLCAIPDQQRAIAEMKRVLRPGGRLLLLDHVAAASRLGRAIQWLLERITIPLGGEHLRRRPLLLVRAAGLQIEQRQRSKLGIVERLAARRPSDPDRERSSRRER
jgi:ubiquinone/menaquinone biosynthesis C-methylase UbiE